MKTIMKLEDKVGLVVIIVSIVLFFAGILYNGVTRGDLRYTIGVLKDIGVARSGWRPIFNYTISDLVVETSGMGQYIVTPNNKNIYVGKRYYVVIDIKDPKFSTILLDYPVPDSIKTAPPFGWDSIPGVGELEIPFVWDGGKSPPIKKK